MSGSTRTLAVLGVCFLLVPFQPALLDLVRLPLALVVSWPGRELAAAARAAEETEPSEAALAAHDAWAFHRESAEASGRVRVIRGPGEDRFIHIALGHADGLRRGAVVTTGDAFVGLVDRVESRLARVRLASHAGCTFDGAVTDEETGLVHEVLLKGDGRALATTEHGSRLPSDLLGADVLTRGAGALPYVRLGRVVWHEVLKETVVELAVDPETIDRVDVRNAVDGGRLTPVAPSIHELLDARVLAADEVGPEARSLWISCGLLDGVVAGAWVSRNGNLVGRVTAVGPWSSRVRPFAADGAAADLVVCPLGVQGEVGHETRTGVAASRAERGVYFTRGRSRRAGPPAGLWAFTAGGRLHWPELPGQGDAVTVHRFLPDEELAALTLGLR